MESGLTSELEIISSLDRLSEAARQVISYSKDVDVWLFEGSMGAGKTTLIKAICQAWGVAENVSSPTFSLVNEYHNNQGIIFYHFDFYRIKSEEEASDIGVDEYFYSDEYCFVEWPSMIPSLLPDEYVSINIEIISETERKIKLSRKMDN